MSTELAPVAPKSSVMEYVPYGSDTAIKLSVSIIQNIVAVPTKSGALPSDQQCIKFMMLCQAQRLNPFAGDAYLVGYDGKDGAVFSLITAHQAFLKRAEVNVSFDGMTSGILLNQGGNIVEREGDFHLADEQSQVVGGWAKVFHKGRAHPTYRKIRLDRFNTGRAQWAVDPAGMIVKCAEADALRSTFPTLLGGMFAKEEMDIEASVRDVTPTGPARPRIPEMFTAGAPAPVAAAPVVEAGPPPPTVEDPNQPLIDLRKKIEKAGVKELTVITYIRELGLADDSLATLDEVFDTKPTAIRGLLRGWATAAAAIKGMEGARP